MERFVYEGKVWADKNRKYSPELLELLTSKDRLIVLSRGKPPYKVILGVPHQAAIGVEEICESKKPRNSDENAVSYALVTFSMLEKHDIPCKLVIVAHSTTTDPNKEPASPYCQEIFRETGELLIECHGAGSRRKLDLELSAGQNRLADTMCFGGLLATKLQQHYTLGVQKQCGTDNALIYQKDGKRSDGRLEMPAIETASLTKAQEKEIRALHLEAKPQFRKPKDGSNEVTADGLVLGRVLAQAIIEGWIKEELKKVEQSYTTQVLNMIGAYNREIERTKEYHGRQLLELLQNVDDEAEKTEDPSMLIRLENDRLVVANNGMPFSRQGVLSLMYSDTSPKIKRQKKIGYKGLGFRAVLNWSESIWIKSGALSLGFSKKNAIAYLNELIRRNPPLKEGIDEASNEKYPIATLSVPTWKETDNLGTSEYDTYIVINFSSEEIRKDIQRQIKELGMEVALFLNNLRKIKLESPEREETILRRQPKEGRKEYEEVQLLDKEGKIIQSREWRIFSKSDKLPENLRRAEWAKQYEYDLRLAVSKNRDDNINRLFSYFKTEVKFPLIIHGTFDLDGNRNHLNDNPINKFLLDQLADLMIETALKLTQESDQVNWDAVKLLARKGEFDDKVERMEFYTKLLSSMKSRKLIPVLSNKYMSPEEGPVFYDVPFAEILKIAPKEFHDLALYTDDKDIRLLIEKVEIKKYDAEVFVNKINRISKSLSIPDRAELILMAAKNHGNCFNTIPPEEMPNLFTDEEGEILTAKTQTLLPPERSKFKLPENIGIVFVSSALANLLKSKAEAKTGTALAGELVCFNVEEYRFDTVIRGVVADTNELVKRNPEKKREYIKGMASSLFQIFHDDTSNKFPDPVSVPLFTRSGELRNARELYFGQEYSVGKIMDALYSGIDETVFLAKREDLGLEVEDENKAVEFLKWVGVEEFPRINQKALEKDAYNSEYEDYVLRKLKYPYYTNRDDTYDSYEKLKADKYGTKITIGDIAELDDILSKSRFEDILVWLHLDPDLQTILRGGHELAGSSFGIRFYKDKYDRNLRPEETSSYILWKLRKAEWVPTRSGKQVKPEKCCLARTLADMSPLIEAPAYNIKDEIFRVYNIKEEDIEHILWKMGASRDFASRPDEAIYASLADLELVDPEGKKAKAIYRQIIDNKQREWARNVANSEARKHFVENGKLLAKSGGELHYFPVKDVYYVDNITFCREIMDKFPIVQIDRRSGKEQVREIFGAKPLEDISFSLNSPPEIHPINVQFAEAFENFKPYILVFRLQKPNVSTERNQLKRLKIVLCNKISATYKYDGTEQPLQINPYEHITAGDENTAYLLMDPNIQYRDIGYLKTDTSFCDSIAEIVTGILKVEENRKGYRELFSKNKQQRDLIIQKDLDDPNLEKLKQASQLFRSLPDLELDFWQAVIEAKGSEKLTTEHASGKRIIGPLARELNLKEEFLAPIYEGIYYEKYSRPSNMPYFRQLFEALEISVEEFNRHSTEPIDFTDYLKSEITNKKYKLLKKFMSYLFRLLKNKPLEIKETLPDLRKAYEEPPTTEYYNINKELALDVGKYFDTLFQNEPFKRLGIKYSDLLQQEETDLDGKYRKNLETLKNRIGETGSFYEKDIKDLLDIQKNRSLLFFGEYGELVIRFDKQYTRPPPTGEEGEGKGIVKRKNKISLNGKEEEYDEDDYESLVNNIEEDLKANDYDILSHEPSRPPEKPELPSQKARGGGRGGAPKKQTKEIGFVGEYYVYKTLVKKYSKEKVRWVSEYAKIANINPNGNDGEGYDIRYLDENDQVHYVEVKSSSDEDCSFPISTPEVRFGEKHKSNYEVIIVQNALTPKRKSINLGRIFEYNEEESFNNNSKFTVENDGFRIRFQIQQPEGN